MNILFGRRFRHGIGVVLLVVGAITIYLWWRQPVIVSDDAIPDNPMHSAPLESSAAPRPEQPDRSAEVASPSLPRECRDQTAAPFVPTSLDIPGVTKGQVVGLGLDENGAPAAPSYDMPNTFSWYDQGPRPNRSLGNVLFQAHTFSQQNVLGNVLLANFRVGDLVIARGEDGQKRCYVVANRQKTEGLQEYVVDANVYDFEGPPQAAITVCSDYDRLTGEWRTRTVWFAEPLPLG